MCPAIKNIQFVNKVTNDYPLAFFPLKVTSLLHSKLQQTIEFHFRFIDVRLGSS